MRATSDDYWNTSLPKDHDALRELDAYCQEWGGLTRAEATRRLLIEWTLRRQGKDLSAWGPNGSARFAALGVLEEEIGEREGECRNLTSRTPPRKQQVRFLTTNYLK
jgi:hypothetical protein